MFCFAVVDNVVFFREDVRVSKFTFYDKLA